MKPHTVGGYFSREAAASDLPRLIEHINTGYHTSSYVATKVLISKRNELEMVVAPEEAILVLASPAPETVAFIVPKVAPGFLLMYIYGTFIIIMLFCTV